MVDSGSQPNIADCKEAFPHAKIVPSEGQKKGLQYKAADGSLIPNRGETTVRHREADGSTFEFVFQDAPVHCPIISVTDLVQKDCTVTFHRLGGHIDCPSGKRIKFVAKGGVFFVLMNVLPPWVTQDAVGRDLAIFARQGHQ